MIDFEAINTTIVVLLAVCAIIGTVWNTYKIMKEAKAPSEERLKRLEKVEEHLDNDNQRLKELEEATRLSLRAQLAIIDHLTTGNHTDTLKQVKGDIQNYLLNR